jgi:signal transduction histidine kinase
MIYTDPQRLKQILLNLLSNSLKFTFYGSIKVTVKVLQSLSKFKCSIEDTGIGIKENDLKKLFKMFGMLENSRGINKTGKTIEIDLILKGSGLGLYICRQFCKLMNGEISAKSTFGKGTKFTFILPMNYSFQNRNNTKSLTESSLNQSVKFFHFNLI